MEKSKFSYINEVSKSHTNLVSALESANYSDDLINKVKDLKSEFRSFNEDFNDSDNRTIKRILSREISEIIGNTEGRYDSIFRNDIAILKSLELLNDQLLYKQTLGFVD